MVRKPDCLGPEKLALTYMNFTSGILRFLLLLLICTPSSLGAQQTTKPHDSERKAVSYGFVSPNTEDNLELAEAIRKLTSAEERRLISEIRRVACRRGFRPRVMRALGSWSDGAEHSTLFKTNTDESTMRYAVSSLGKYARQKTVLYFQQNETGEARLYILYPPRYRRSLLVLARSLDRLGIADRTLVPLKNKTLVYVVDLKNALGKAIATAARNLRAQVKALRGVANFLGDDSDRQKAQQTFEREMQSFESVHPEIPGKCSAH